MTFIYSILSFMLAYSAFFDIRKKRVPNIICLLIMVMGLLSNSLLESGIGLFNSVLGLCVGFLPIFLIHVLTGLGAGDVKLMASIGSVVGAKAVLIVFYYTFLLYGMFALGVLLIKGGLIDMIRRYGRFFGGLVQGNPVLDKPIEGSSASLQIPMAPGIALATIYTLLPSICHLAVYKHALWN